MGHNLNIYEVLFNVSCDTVHVLTWSVVQNDLLDQLCKTRLHLEQHLSISVCFHDHSSITAALTMTFFKSSLSSVSDISWYTNPLHVFTQVEIERYQIWQLGWPGMWTSTTSAVTYSTDSSIVGKQTPVSILMEFIPLCRDFILLNILLSTVIHLAIVKHLCS